MPQRTNGKDPTHKKEVIREEALWSPEEKEAHAISSIQEAYGPTPYDRTQLEEEEQTLEHRRGGVD